MATYSVLIVKFLSGSDEELEDIKLAYTKYEGDMGKILDSIMCATVKDEPRFRSIINDLIESGELPAFEAFINEPKEKQATRKRKVGFSTNYNWGVIAIIEFWQSFTSGFTVRLFIAIMYDTLPQDGVPRLLNDLLHYMTIRQLIW